MLEKDTDERIESPAHELLDRVEGGIDKSLETLRVLARNHQAKLDGAKLDCPQ